MNERTSAVTISCLLHGTVGLPDGMAPDNMYIVRLSEKIANGHRVGCEEPERNRREIPAAPLRSVFNRLNGNKKDYCYPLKSLDGNTPYPMDERDVSGGSRDIPPELRGRLESAAGGGENINYLLAVLEDYFSFVPSDALSAESADISAYDCAKMAAAVGAVISEYMREPDGENLKPEDLKAALNDDESEFRDKQIFLMVSCDFSGIQSFIYSIVSDGALKSLRSRSFILQILMEHCVDEILESCGLSRANLIYSGGGHCYMLLPNTRRAVGFLERFRSSLGEWLRRQFGTGLYMAAAWQPCSANEAFTHGSRYKRIFQELSGKLSAQKLYRYSPDELRALNSAGSAPGTRECKVCGTASRLGDDELCAWCGRLRDISGELLKDNLLAVMDEPEPGLPNIPFPTPEGGETYIHFISEERADDLFKTRSARRIYSKNKRSRFENSVRIFMGNYCSNSLIDELTGGADGIRRVGVFRADVDNLGLAFTNGFESVGEGMKDISERYRYVTLTRSAAFSRQMSMFFQYYINNILAGNDPHSKNSLSPKGRESGGKRVIVVYSGGDDIFMMGNWSDVIEAAMDIREAFTAYTAGALTLSAGIGMYGVKYPVAKEASETEELEAESKNHPGKNAITLFSANSGHTYSWDDFSRVVIGEKLAALQDFFAAFDDKNEQERGNAFLYRLLALLRGGGKKINIARYVYMLARMEPSKSAADSAKIKYKVFSEKMFRWIHDDNDRRSLITAIYIFVYLTRKRRDK